MDDILDLQPDPLELEQFHREVIRPTQPIFHPNGQYCVVKRCSSMVKYHSLRDLITHWKFVHNEYKEMYKCKPCRKMFSCKNKVKRHLDSFHKIKTDQDRCIISVFVPNEDYIPPADAVIPRNGSAEENEEILQRDREWEANLQRDREREANARRCVASSSRARLLAERVEAEEALKDFK